jgi:glutamate-ammonia-ligase adenylyltransferase
LSQRLAARFASVLGSPLLESRLATVAAPFIERRGGDSVLSQLADTTLLGVARLVSASGESSRLLASRPELLERLGAVTDGVRALELRSGELLARESDAEPEDLEEALDGLRLLRREETIFVSCLDLGGAVPFGDVSRFLSVLAESILRRSLRLAGSTAGPGPSISVIGMGKIGGREFTHHSDLDLLFLYEGGADDVVRVSRVGQRLVSYLTTMTRTGVAYAVDTRLRPSGHQGLLVTSFDAFDAYQRSEAQLWEHLVLVRARAVAGDIELAGARLARTREAVLRNVGIPWNGVADMRARVERERGDESDGRLALKTGPGGLMDVDFLAAGGWLVRGAGRPSPAAPGNAALLRALVPGLSLEQLLEAYDALRVVEARARLVTGRALEAIEATGEAGPLTAALLGLPDREALAAHVEAWRSRVRDAWRRVVAARSIVALDEC